ncbi:MAG TPA: PDZ domain-containing protein, partial [Gemmatales bacterium]|nr:PDZ domain-containing protein [Gemmatales bacterium]
MRYTFLALFVPALLHAQASHPKDPRQQDRQAVLPGYVELRQVVTVEAPKTWNVNEVQPQPGFVGIAVEPPQGSFTYWKISGVSINSPAAKAGLKEGDALVIVGGQTVVDGRLLGDYLRSRTAGESVKFTIERDGKRQDVLVKAEATSRPLSATGAPPTLGIRTTETVDGVKVESMQPSSPAESAGVKAGDIIIKMDDETVTGSELLTNLIASRKVGDLVQLVVLRSGKEIPLAVKMAGNESAGGRGGRQNTRWDERSATTFQKSVYRLAIVPIEYSDVKHNPRFGLTDWEKMLFSTGTYVGTSPSGQPVYGSMNDFYREQSYGKFRVDGQAFQWVQVSRKRADYSNDTVRNALLRARSSGSRCLN